MILLELLQNETRIILGTFESLQTATNFVKSINETLPGVIVFNTEEGAYYLDGAKLPSYVEVRYKNYLVPLTSLSFLPESIEVVFTEVTNLDSKDKSAVVESSEVKTAVVESSEVKSPALVSGTSLVDGYAFENSELHSYIKKREALTEKVFSILKGKGFKPEINFFGSEDGSAICYTDSNNQWHFLTHLDPSFVLNTPPNLETLKPIIEELL